MKLAGLMLGSACRHTCGWACTFLLIVAVTVMLTPASHAQTAARLSGIVVDATGGVLPGATVTLKDEASGTETKATTDSSGVYFFDPVLPRVYTLVVQMVGFSTYEETGIQVHPSDHLNIRVDLKIGGVQEQVNVTAESVNAVTTDSGSKSEVITAQQIENLSTIGRNAMELLTILPGVVAGGSGGTGNSYNALQGSGFVNNSINSFNVNGLRNDMNDIRSDGSSVLGPGNNGTYMMEPNMDMIAEISVKTSNFEADQGRGAMIVETVTKSGGNKFHGALYWYHRDPALDANDWSSNHVGAKKPNSLFNYPGFNIGGPAIIPGTSFNKNRDKTFFFFGSEWQRQKPDNGSVFGVVPTDQMRKGNFSELLNGSTCASTGYYLQQPCQLSDPATGAPLNGNVIDPGQIADTGRIQLSLYPEPNYTDPTNRYNYASRSIRPLNRNEQILRVDQNISEKTRLYIRLARNSEYAYYDYGEVWSNAGDHPSNVVWPTPIVSPSSSRSISANLSRTFTPRLINEFQFGSTALSSFNQYQDPNIMSKTAAGYNFAGIKAFNAQSDGIPMMLDFGGTPGTNRWSQYGGDFSAGMGSKFTNFEWTDSLSWSRGTHMLKFGFTANRTRVDQRQGNKVEGLLATGAWGTTTGDEFGDILTDHYKYYAQSNSDPTGFFRYTNVEGYLQDSWKATHRLTFNYGLRVSYLSPWVETHGLAVTFDPTKYDSSQPNLPLNGLQRASAGEIPKSVVPSPKPVFQPRVGFAWDVFGNAKSVFRGGFGVYTLRDQGNTIMNWSFRNPPNVYTVEFADWCCGGFGHADIENADPYGVLGNLLISARDRHDDAVPRTYEYSLTWSQAVGLKTVVETSYVGNKSDDLFGYYNLNAVPLGAMWVSGTQTPASSNSQPYRPYNPWGSINWAQHNLSSNYNSLQVTVKRNVAHGLTLQAAYTFSKSLGDQGSAGDAGDAFFRDKGYGILGYDRDQTLSVAYVYDIPSVARRLWGGNRVTVAILDNWKMSGVTRYVAGPPISVSIANVSCVGSDAAGTALCNTFVGGSNAGITWYGTSDEPVRPVLSKKPDAGASFHQVGDPWVGTDFFSLPAMGEYGNFRQPTFRAPGYNNWDWALAKSFPIGESRSIDFRWSMFDMFNRAQPAFPSMSANMNWVLNKGATSLADGVSELANSSISTFGLILTKTGHRQMELALKVHF